MTSMPSSDIYLYHPQEERRTKAVLYLGRAAAAVEENNFCQLLSGAEREAEKRQRVAR